MGNAAEFVVALAVIDDNGTAVDSVDARGAVIDVASCGLEPGAPVVAAPVDAEAWRAPRWSCPEAKASGSVPTTKESGRRIMVDGRKET